ncbi:MAG: penicillin-binding transpeptidase domain-containing protein, partial [bacterium]
DLIAIVGSPQPGINAYGYKINMAVRPRPIGSTIKPFIYLKGFEKNLRPYTIVEDKEYKYEIGTGFAFYPKNYDYEYRGPVSLHYALSNSLNVPSVKVLEYAGLKNFYSFLENDLKFRPIQDLNNYQLGIALGELEMDLLTLSYYFTIFPNEGILKPLQMQLPTSASDPRYNPRQIRGNSLLSKFSDTAITQISKSPYIRLINKILSDRITGIEQFGETSDLNLFAKNYAVKTGTSREYHDSWVIGYTPDFLIGVWIGNSDDTPMDAVSGQGGAGRVWHEAMDLLLNSSYNKNTPFNFDYLAEFTTDDGIDYGFKNDDYEKFKNLLKDDSLILNPHNGDTFLFEPGMEILLTAREETEWFINDSSFGTGDEIIFSPAAAGNYTIKAKLKNAEEIIKIFVEKE